MAGRPVTNLSHGECGWKVLDKLLRERSMAIQNLSTRSPTSLRLPRIESPVPRLLVNSEEVWGNDKHFDGSTESIADTDQMPAPEGADVKNDCDITCVNRHPSNKPATLGSDGDLNPNRPRFLTVPSVKNDTPFLRRRRSVGEADFGPDNDPQKNRASNGSSKSKEQIVNFVGGASTSQHQIPSLNHRCRSLSPSLRSSVSAPTLLSRPRSPHPSCRTSPTSSPDTSPSVPRRHYSLSISGGVKGPPTNTENRLRTRSAHFKLQKLLDDSKSQFTTAQTLEIYGNSEKSS